MGSSPTTGTSTRGPLVLGLADFLYFYGSFERLKFERSVLYLQSEMHMRNQKVHTKMHTKSGDAKKSS